MRIIICLGDRTRSGTFFAEKEYYPTRTVPQLARSTKLSPARQCQYLDGWPTDEIYNLFSFFVFLFSPSLFKPILKPAELLALWNVVSSTSVYQQFVPHFDPSIFFFLRLRISLIVACGIASERLALTAGFEAVLDNEGKRLDASLSNSIRHSIFGYI